MSRKYFAEVGGRNMCKTISNMLLSYYLIAFGYFAQFEILYHLLYVISSTLKE